MVDIDVSQIRYFIEFLIYRLPEQQALLLFFIHKNGSQHIYFTNDTAHAVRIITEHREWNCYYGVGARLLRLEYPHKWRGTAQDVVSLFEVHADIDFLSEEGAHKKTDLPPTMDAARAIVEKLPLPPTMLTCSGNGLQSHLFFKEGELLSSPEERTLAKEAVQRYQYGALRIARQDGHSIDSTFNIDRVLRIPGTLNWKTAEPRLCYLLVQDGPEYAGLNDFYDNFPVVPDDTNASEVDRTVAAEQSKGLVFTPHAISLGTFETLRENRQFTRTWNKERKDLNDTSQSGYDMSLACMALKRDLTFQETLSLLIQYRTHHNRLDYKESYLLRTLQRAYLFIRTATTDVKAAERVEHEIRDTIQREHHDARIEEERHQPELVYREVEEFWECPTGWTLRSVTKAYGFQGNEETHLFLFVLRNPEGELIDITIHGDDILKLEAVRKKVKHVIHRAFYVDKKREEKWRQLHNRLVDVCMIDRSQQVRVPETVRQLLEQWAGNATDVNQLENPSMFERHIYNHLPVFDIEDDLYFPIKQFVAYVQTFPLHRHLSEPICAQALYRLGATVEKRNMPHRRGATRRVWKLARQALLTPYEGRVEETTPSVTDDDTGTTPITLH